jgi:hypothetical protein
MVIHAYKILVLGRLRHDHHEFKASLGYITRLPQKTNKKNQKLAEHGGTFL